MTARSAAVGRGQSFTGASTGVAWLAWAVPLALFVVAAAVRLAVAALVPFPATEGSAYYVGVARNLVEGEGLMTDSLWSYATPPLTLPRPAFELWMPMSSLVAAAGMSLLGTTFWAAQVATAVVGALLAPLTWAVARSAGADAGLDRRRGAAVAFASGLLVAIASPLVLAAAVPDSYTAYVVASVAAALLVPRVVMSGRVRVVPGLALGIALGIAYLARQEVIWLGAAVVAACWVASGRGDAASRAGLDPARSEPTASRRGRIRTVLVRLSPVLAGGLLVVLPWLARNASVFGTPFPGQTLENAILRRNEDIYGFAERPTLAAYLDQGAATLIGNPVAAAWDGLLNVLVIPAFPLGVVGLIAWLCLRRSPAFRVTGSLGVLLLSGLLTFVTTAVLFPVATRWGTFLHASGPLLVALVVAAALGGDALLARVSAFRSWPKPNVIVAPIALVAVTLMLLALQVLVVSEQARTLRDRYAGLHASLDEAAGSRGEPIPDVLISDHPIWVTDVLGRASIALPDEDLASIERLGTAFGTTWLLVMDRRGRYPGALLSDDGGRCLAREPLALANETATSSPAEPGWLFILRPGCASETEAGA